jgi:hypothetical protein
MAIAGDAPVGKLYTSLAKASEVELGGASAEGNSVVSKRIILPSSEVFENLGNPLPMDLD